MVGFSSHHTSTAHRMTNWGAAQHQSTANYDLQRPREGSNSGLVTASTVRITNPFPNAIVSSNNRKLIRFDEEISQNEGLRSDTISR
jgi:hypothetical protein